jgi:DHA3 family multidrug efflux protein-like MFS transporter
MKTFHRLLVNALISTVMTSFLWFALTFWVYLETRSVLATSVIGGAFAIFSSVFGILFGTFVDHHRKWTAMMVAALITLVMYGLALLQYGVVSNESLLSFRSPNFWILVALVLAGSVVGNMRSIAMSTTVTLLVPEEHRDRANGLVGTVMGVSFAITSVLSGLVVGRFGMGWALVFAVALTAVSVVHLLTIRFDEPEPERSADGERPPAFDIKGSLAAISGVAGLYGLIFFAAFNNMLGGGFMSLMDAYGLSLMSVEAWGVLFGVVSFGMIGGGLYVSKKGLGSRPMRVILICNLVNWSVCTVFTLQSNIPLLFIGMLVWMSLMPAIEAAEQTVLQQVVPFEQQGRVFGFAQTVETAASPVTALLIGPFAQFVAMPFMTDGAGVDLIGGWFGSGEERGIALIFTVAGILGVLATFAARASNWYRHLSELTDTPSADSEAPDDAEPEAFVH